jgi:hypothetical protein
MTGSAAGTAGRPQVLSGPGGVGKTALAVEYVYRNASDYDLVWWLPAKHPTSVRRSLAELARAMGLPAGDGMQTAALRALSSGEPYQHWLLAYDHANSFDELRDVMPESVTGRILITSRNPDWPDTATVMEIGQRPAIRDRLFICYSHVDSAALHEIRVHLTALKRDSLIKTWDDTQIRPGARWQNEIGRALASTRVALLLVSPDFLASSLVMNDEVPALLRAAENEGVTILCLILRPCLYERFPMLSQFQAVNSPRRPLSALSRYQREQALVNLVTTIEEELNA